jgi:F-type H+-transporting ATPase subunit delta
MRAASREAYGSATEQLAGVTRERDAAALATLGDELLAVAELLDREPALRRAVADPARSGEDRAGLLDRLIADAVGADTRTLLGGVARGRWSSAGELVDGVELLGVGALLGSAERAGHLSDVEDELFRFGQVVDGSRELAAALGDTRADAAARGSIVDSVLHGKADPVTIRLIKLALAGFGGRGFTAGLSRLVDLAAERRDRQIALVTVAAPLTEAQEQELADRLAQINGQQVAIKVTLDPSVLGGVRVQIGSDLYDGTALRRLSDARHALTGT